MAHVINETEVNAFHRDGYVIVKNFFSKEEIDKLYSIAISDNVVKTNALDLNDQPVKKQNSLYGSHRVMMCIVVCCAASAW